VSFLFSLCIALVGVRNLVFATQLDGLSLVGSELLRGIFSPLAEPLAEQLNLSPAALLGVGGLLLLLVLCVQLSISISGLQEQVRTLAEEASYLRQELDETRS
jgi:hypothetical protein